MSDTPAQSAAPAVLAGHLEGEAVDLVRRHRLFLPATIKGFLKRLARELRWQALERELGDAP